MEGIPCFINCSMAAGECSQAEFMTLDEATEKHSAYLERQEKIRRNECPDCGAEIIDDRIKGGKYDGHGKIVCPEWQKALVII